MKKLLYIFDNINYINGVQKTTAVQISSLVDDYDISLWSLAPAEDMARKLFGKVHFVDIISTNQLSILSVSFKDAIFSKKYNLKHKFMRLFYTIYRKIGNEKRFYEQYDDTEICEQLEEYDVVFVLSESSVMRETVSKLKHPKKVQWVHTDYKLWSEYSSWTRQITANDGELYKKYNNIVFVSEKSREGFIKKYLDLSSKTCVIKNMMNVQYIKQKSDEKLDFVVDSTLPNLITIARLNTEKAFDRLIKICKKLIDDGLRFNWYIVGDGTLYDDVKNQIIQMQLTQYVHMTGHLDNPYPLLKQCDVFALLSLYEGLPITVYEALILGIPVFATNVGGIPEQVVNGANGVLVDNSETDIYNGLKRILSSTTLVEIYKNNLKNYVFDNQSIKFDLIKKLS